MRKLSWLCFILALLPRTLSAIEVSEAELTQLRGIFSELGARSIEQAKLLTQAQTALAEARTSLEAAKASLTTYSEEVAKTLQATRAERDGWRIVSVATGIAGVVGIILALIFR
jgi:ElaB/YqjD/DUF883 family membrane-anchored ribosome-binding protein